MGLQTVRIWIHLYVLFLLELKNVTVVAYGNYLVISSLNTVSMEPDFSLQTAEKWLKTWKQENIFSKSTQIYFPTKIFSVL